MIKPLEILFEKLGLRGYEDLKPHERRTFEQWEHALRDEVKVEDLKNSLLTRLAQLREMRENEDGNVPGDPTDIERLAEIRVVKGMLGKYAKTAAAKKQAEAEINKAVETITSKQAAK